VHEPPVFSLLSSGDVMARALTALAAEGMRTDPRAAMTGQARQALSDAFDRLTPDLREALIANAETFLGVEVPALVATTPTPETLADTLGRTMVPIRVAACPGAPLWRTSRWIADRLGADVHELPGGHVPYATEPQATAEALRHWAGPR
jgi:hypothetical protein